MYVCVMAMVLSSKKYRKKNRSESGFWITKLRGLWLCCLLWPVLGFGQDSLVPDGHFHLYNGLPTRVLYSMCRDPQGFIWIGSENGVYRFDVTEAGGSLVSVTFGLNDTE